MLTSAIQGNAQIADASMSLCSLNSATPVHPKKQPPFQRVLGRCRITRSVRPLRGTEVPRHSWTSGWLPPPPARLHAFPLSAHRTRTSTMPWQAVAVKGATMPSCSHNMPPNTCVTHHRSRAGSSCVFGGSGCMSDQRPSTLQPSHLGPISWDSYHPDLLHACTLGCLPLDDRHTTSIRQAALVALRAPSHETLQDALCIRGKPCAHTFSGHTHGWKNCCPAGVTWSVVHEHISKRSGEGRGSGYRGVWPTAA
jgi:hypothetical protein